MTNLYLLSSLNYLRVVNYGPDHCQQWLYGRRTVLIPKPYTVTIRMSPQDVFACKVAIEITTAEECSRHVIYYYECVEDKKILLCLDFYIHTVYSDLHVHVFHVAIRIIHKCGKLPSRPSNLWRNVVVKQCHIGITLEWMQHSFLTGFR
jgi:hypothetical protein